MILKSTWYARTASALTHPSAPFGLMGSWTRYHLAEQFLPTLAASALKVVGTPFALRDPKVATTAPPGLRYADAGRRRTSASVCASYDRNAPAVQRGGGAVTLGLGPGVVVAESGGGGAGLGEDSSDPLPQPPDTAATNTRVER